MYSDRDPANNNDEIGRLLDLLPASGRMKTRLLVKPSQQKVVEIPLPMPWELEHPVCVNFDLLCRLERSQRDLLVLRSVCWATGARWLRVDGYRLATAAAAIATLVELASGDAVGTFVAGGLAFVTGRQVWQSIRGLKRELEADEAAVQVALRRGYEETTAARALLEAIEGAARLEGRTALGFAELIRSQQLRSLAGLSPIRVPERVRERE